MTPPHIQEEKSKETIIVFCLIGCLLFLFFKKYIFLYGVILLSIIGIWLPRETLLIHTYWMTFSKYLGKFNSFLILSISYIFILTPISFIQRIGNRDPLHLRNENKDKVKSYFTIENRKVDPERFDKMG